MHFACKTGLMVLGLLSLSGCALGTAIQLHDMGSVYMEKPVYGVHGYYVHMKNHTGIGFDLNDKQQRYEIAEKLVGPTCQSPSVAGERVIDEGTTYFLTNSPRREYVIEIKCADSQGANN
jgi:hypothetical protein